MTAVGKRRFRNLKIARNALLFTFRANKISGTAFFAARKIRRGQIFLFCYFIGEKLLIETPYHLWNSGCREREECLFTFY